MIEQLRAPFPYFGGKSSVAALVWQRFGNVANYVEAFFGSGAVLLGRPHEPGIESINDADGFVSNFWRAVQADPDAVCSAMDWPVNERDLAARHYWLVTEGCERVAALQGDPLGYDAQVAGWWCWGLCSWIGSGWCNGEGPWQWRGGAWQKREVPVEAGINRKRPHLGGSGGGVSINSGAAGDLRQWIFALSQRLRRVRVTCGDWSRVCGPSVTFKHGLTGIFLDPPYSAEAGRTSDLYAVDCLSVAHDVRAWCIANGGNKKLRICLAGYDGEHAMPDGWECVAWRTQGGYGNQGDDIGRDNAAREVLWFSPHCLAAHAPQYRMDFATMGAIA